MKKIVILSALLTACATPRVWVQSTTSTGGVIGYQDYDPNRDNMQRIRNLIPCDNFRKVWNGIKSQQGAPTYTYSWGMLVPINNGVVQWMEYQYECE